MYMYVYKRFVVQELLGELVVLRLVQWFCHLILLHTPQSWSGDSLDWSGDSLNWSGDSLN
jgi:hypothetical protein